MLHVGVHVEPSASVEVHHEPGASLVMAPDASQEAGLEAGFELKQTLPPPIKSKFPSPSTSKRLIWLAFVRLAIAVPAGPLILAWLNDQPLVKMFSKYIAAALVSVCAITRSLSPSPSISPQAIP